MKFISGGKVLALMGICLTLCGCPYESKTPLSTVEESVMDGELPGLWECRSEKDDPAWFLTVFRFDSRQYYLYLTAPNEKPAHFRAYATLIKGKPFLNVQELDVRRKAAGDRYWFLSYEKGTNGNLSMKIVRDELLKEAPASSQALRDSIGSRIGDPRLFEDFCICRRLPETNVH